MVSASFWVGLLMTCGCEFRSLGGFPGIDLNQLHIFAGIHCLSVKDLFRGAIEIGEKEQRSLRRVLLDPSVKRRRSCFVFQNEPPVVCVSGDGAVVRVSERPGLGAHHQAVAARRDAAAGRAPARRRRLSQARLVNLLL